MLICYLRPYNLTDVLNVVLLKIITNNKSYIVHRIYLND